MKQWIIKNLSGGKVLLLFVLANIVLAVMLMITIPKTMAYANGMELLDVMPTGYSADYIRALFEALGQEGRAVYLYNQIPIDMFYPFLFGLSYCLITGYFLNKLGKINTGLFYLCFLPIMAGLADYMENITIISMLYSYPELNQFSAAAANIFTITKSAISTVYFCTLMIIMVVFAFKKRTISS